MPSIRLSKQALEDLTGLRSFTGKKPNAAKRAADRITAAIDQLIQFPLLGRPCPEEASPAGFREHSVSFGSSGYVVLYQTDPDFITIVAIRHQRESGFDLSEV